MRDKESEMPLSSSGGSSDVVSEIGVVRDCRRHCYHRYGKSPFVIEPLKLCLKCCGVIRTAVTHLHAHRWNTALRALEASLEVVGGVEGVEDEEGEWEEREEGGKRRKGG